jgi:TetR/AcrR family transcriptional regulator
MIWSRNQFLYKYVNWVNINGNYIITSVIMQLMNKSPKQATEVRQASLVLAALRLAAQRSPADITTTDLAQAVGITQGAVFKHFASKDAIWLAAMDWVTHTLMDQLDAAATQAQLDDTVWPLAALRAVFMAHVDFAVAHPGVPRLIFQELQRPDDTALKARVRQLMASYRTLLMRLLTQAKELKCIAPGTDLPSAAVLFIGSIQGLVMQSLLSGDVPAMVQQANGVFAIYQRGLLTHTPATSPSF